MTEELEPITIIRTQWRGDNERHYWVAFCHRPTALPWFMGLDEEAERRFFKGEEAKRFIFGLGNTPGSALVKMYKNKRV